MRNKHLRNSVLFFAVFFLTLILVLTVDVQNGVGLYSINGQIHSILPFNQTVFDISNWFGLSAFIVVAFFGCTGLVQWIKRKNLLKVDNEILLLGIMYILMAVIYFLFSKIVINYRPVIIDGVNEPSFPSSHTFLFISVFVSGIWNIRRLVASEKTAKLLSVCFFVVLGLGVLSRLLSGSHWLTDILASIVLSGGLLELYAFACETVKIGGKK